MKTYPQKDIQDILSKIEEVKNDISGLKNKTDYINGVVCPKCGSFSNKIFNSRETEEKFRIRRRKCLDCENRWTTVEVITDLGFTAKINQLEEHNDGL